MMTVNDNLFLKAIYFFKKSLLIIGIFLGYFFSNIYAEEMDDIEKARKNLVSNPPFASSGIMNEPIIASKSSSQYELNGIIRINGEWQFSIYDTKGKISLWIALNDPKAPLKVVSFNEKNNSIVIIDKGQAQELLLKKPIQGSDSPGLSFPGLSSGLSSPSIPPDPSKNTGPITKEAFLELLKKKQEEAMKLRSKQNERQRPEMVDEDDDDDDIDSAGDFKLPFPF